MKISQILLLPEYEDKLLAKHQVTPAEVEDVTLDRPHIRFIERGNQAGEDLYAAYGQTRAGRYLVVFFLIKPNRTAFVVSARDMDSKERKRYGRQR